MSQAVVTSVVTNHPCVTAIESSNSYAVTTTVAKVSPSVSQPQSFSSPEASVSAGQYSQLSAFPDGYMHNQQPKIKLLTRPHATSNGTANSEVVQLNNMDQLPSVTNITDVSTSSMISGMTQLLSGENGSNEWQQQPMALVGPSERCDDENPSVNLHEFLANTMRSPQDHRDRVYLLQLEEMFSNYIKDPTNTNPMTLPPDTSYHRMLAHRVAAYFGLKHSVDPTGNAVVVWKIAESKVPEHRFEEHIPAEDHDTLEPKKQILKRSKELVATATAVSQKVEQSSAMSNADMKSIEEKQEAYDRAKARIFSQESRNGSRPQQQQSLLSDATEAALNNSTGDHSDVKFPSEEPRDDTSPGSRSRSSSQGSNVSSSWTTPSRSRPSSNRRPQQQPKFSPRQSYVQPGNYMATGYQAQPIAPGMLPMYYQQQQQQQQAAMLQQYNSQGFPQFVPFGLNPMMNPAAAAMYQQNMNYAFQHHPQQFYLNNNGQVYLANPAMRPVYMHSQQQQGVYHHPHLQNTAAATGIIRPVPQHAQPQANRFVSKPAHSSSGLWKPVATQPQQQVGHLRTAGGNVTAAAIQEYQLANHMESGLVLNNDMKEDRESTEQSPQQTTPVTSSGQQLSTQQVVVTASPQYSSVPQEHDGGQITTAAHESSFPVKIIPHMTSTGQVQYVAAPVNSHGYPAHLTGATMAAAAATNPYSYQLQNAPSTPPITMINPSQPVLFSPPSSGPPTPSHYIPQGLFSPPPQPPILVGMGTAQTQQQQQLSNLVTQQSSTEGKESSSSSDTRPVVTNTNTNAIASNNEKTISTSDTVQQASSTQAVTTSISTSGTTTLNKQKDTHITGNYSATDLPPRFQQRTGGSATRYQNQRHPSNRQSTKQMNMDVATASLAMTNHYGPLSSLKREPLLPTPTTACIIPHDPLHSGGQEILEILRFPTDVSQSQAALVELKKLNASILNIKKGNGEDIYVARFESPHHAQMAIQQTNKQQPYQLVVPSPQHKKIILAALSRHTQQTAAATNRSST
ncbi:cAMP-regulated phosphoprotein 21-like isoform X2 [Dysidea avara]|uniref:cAMP-regulated phosphoprotein 21-like isoform X2 n=1 Tax=Dysidea avara TaxID=196820 RepID=UPI00332CA572